MGILIYRGGGINLKNIYIKFSLIIGIVKLGIFRCIRVFFKCIINKVNKLYDYLEDVKFIMLNCV